MRRKVILLIGILFIGFVFQSKATVDAVDQESNDYYLIHYNGEEQEILVSEDVVLKLTGWTDESKTSADAEVHYTESLKNITMNVTDKVSKVETISYRLVASNTYKVEILKNSEKDNQTTDTEKLNTDETNQLVQSQSEAPIPSINYNSFVGGIGWQEVVSNGQTSGIAGSNLKAIKVSLDQAPYTGDVIYSTYDQSQGWANLLTDDQVSETTEETNEIEAIKIDLSGEIANYYDVYYRVLTKDFGWLGWTKNGMKAGSENYLNFIEAIEVVLVAEGGVAPGSTDRSFVSGPSIVYSSHVQSYGWMDEMKDGQMSGTKGESKRLEAININLQDSPYSGGLVYSTHVKDYGWLNEVTNGEMAGTLGESKRMEAIKINLTGEMANHYDIYYRVHAQNFGWLGWAQNGMKAGTEGLSKRIEAIEVVLVEKDGPAPGSMVQPYVTTPSAVYSSHVQSYGWMSEVIDGQMSGTKGQSKRLEAVKISLKDGQYAGDIVYSTHVQGYGWLNEVQNGDVSGTNGESKRMEAIKIELRGEIANHYDVYYRVHAQNFGWLGWARNGAKAGTAGLSKRLEAIEVILIKKGKAAPGSMNLPYISSPSIVYSSHVQSYGWMDEMKNGQMSGTKGESKRLEAIKINLQDGLYSGGLVYSTHVQGYGWLNEVKPGEVSGTNGESKRMEAIKIALTGDIANYYDVYYRVHAQNFGWMGWARNGMKAGTQGLSKRIEAVEIKLVSKGKGDHVSQLEAFKRAPTVFLDPGHGGRDPGAVAGGYNEKDLNLPVSKKVKSLLVARGYTVHMSRENDTYLSLYERAEMANELELDIFVSIHANSTGTASTSVHGVESFYYRVNPDHPPKINHTMHDDPDRMTKSVVLTNLVHDSMLRNTGAYNRRLDGQAFAVLRETVVPATLIEMGYINNSSDRQKLITNSYQDKLAKSIADGIDDYFEIY
ncbi:N-acetylmuramoyl-L-alanine amidase [Aquibacillus halophilus]|nr:N-acetylmuramoyl-L-alanine amidase [Aquibacillus halophilus]